MKDQVIVGTKKISFEKYKSPILLNRPELFLLKLRIFNLLFRTVLKKGIGFWHLLNLVPEINKRYKNAFGESFLSKVVKVDNRFFWRFGTPGFPSLAAKETAENEIMRSFPLIKDNGKRSLLVLFAITKKCPLKCEHCYDWNNHNLIDNLTTSEIIHIVHKFQDYGATQISFGGGEPMLRINDIHRVLKVARPWTDFWINTSGLGLNEKRAHELKKSGLTGVMVSLDHFKESSHDKFRGFKGSYKSAIHAVINASNAGLVSGLSLCPTKEFISKANINQYMQLARKLGVSFVQFMEPRAAGRYFGKNVELGKEEIKLLEDAYLEYNAIKEYRNYPIIQCDGYVQRKLGCSGAGNRYFFIDADGDAHICPLCENKVANTLKFSASDVIGLLNQHSCHDFTKQFTYNLENVLLQDQYEEQELLSP